MAEVSPAGTRGEYHPKPAKEYHVRVKMTAGPFEINQENDSVIHLPAEKP